MEKRLQAAGLTFILLSFCLAPAYAMKAPPQSHWGFQVLTEAMFRGLLVGYPHGEIEPDRLCTRAEFSAMLVRLLSQEGRVKALARLTPLFTDLPLDHWAKGYMELLSEMGIVKGDTAGRALPDKIIAREEAATLLERTLSAEGVVASGGQPLAFGDEGEIAQWAKEAFNRLSALRIVLGDKGQARPKDPLTRAQAAALAIRAMDALGKRYDVAGEVVEINKNAEFIVVSCQGNSVTIKLDRDALVFDKGKSIDLLSVKQGDHVGVILNGETGLAKVLSLISR